MSLSKRRGGLGRGLGALIGTSSSQEKEVSESENAVIKSSENQNNSVKNKINSNSVNGQSSLNVSRETSNNDVKKTAKTSVKTSDKTGKRPSIPDIASSISGTDFFFEKTGERTSEKSSKNNGENLENTGIKHGIKQNVSRETSADKSEMSPVLKTDKPTGKVEKPADHLTEKSTVNSAEKLSEPLPIKGVYLENVSVDDICANKHQPRTVFNEDELQELSESIKEVGILQPIVVRKAVNSDKHYELIMGERRLRASRLAGMKEIPAIVRTATDDKMLRDALLENLQRVALNPIEEAAAYDQMIKEFGLSQDQIAQSVSKSRPYITNTMRLLRLPSSVQNKLAAGVLSAGHGRALLGLKDKEWIEPLSRRIIAEGLSVRSIEEIVALKNGNASKKKAKESKKENPWLNSKTIQDLEDKFETKVNIRGTKKKGKIEISFSSADDLNRILSLLEDKNDDSASDGWV